MFANEIRPYQCHAGHRRQTRDAVDVAQVGVFKHKDIDVDLTEFPVSAIEAQNQSCLYWLKCKYHLRDKVKVESIFGKKSLYAPQIGITFNARRHRRRYLVHADRLHDTKGVKYKRKQFYASQILAAQALRDDTIGPRCSCIIWTILLTLSQSPGVVTTFMGKAAKPFFKVTNFRDFRKI